MEDRDIIKALECCMKEDGCEHCPYYTNERYTCGEHFNKDMFDLINRQNAEIERLTIEYVGFQAGVKQFAKDGKKVESEAFTDFMVRLKRKIDFYRECDNLDRISVLCHLEQDMHNLVKEMVGE